MTENGSRTKSPDERRNELLDAAENILADKGLGALTVDRVVTRAGVAKGTFYLYFQSKEHVLAALRDRFVESMVERQQAAMDELPVDDWLGRLERWMEEGARGYLASTGLHDALFLHRPSTDRLRAGYLSANRHVDALEGVLHAGAEAGAFSLTSPKAAAVVLYAAFHGAADYVLDHPGDVVAEQLLTEVRRLSRRYVTGG